MQEKPRLVVSKSRRSETANAAFSFGVKDIPHTDGPLTAYQEKAWAEFLRQRIPDVTQEAWRRTDIRAIPAASFKLPLSHQSRELSPVPPELLQSLVANQHAGQVVLTPSQTKIELDPGLAEKGVIFTDLRTARRTYPQVLDRILGHTVNVEESKFAAMAGALAETGVLLYVPKGLSLDQPLHSVLWGPGASLAHISHILVFLDDGATATYVHEYASPTENADSLHTGIVEIKVNQHASLKFVELQSWGKHVWNFTHERVRLEGEANIDWIFGAVGSKLTKNFSELDLAGEGSTGRMSGFYFADGNQHLDHDTQQNHLAARTTSDLLFKGALKGHSRSVWQGMIYVAKDAQKTDGYQANRNIILEEGARADSIPGLEILADDVRCTHGATVGRLEQEPLFYLKSRGIPQAEAARIVVEGFFDPVMQRIPFEGVRERFQQAIVEKMK